MLRFRMVIGSAWALACIAGCSGTSGGTGDTGTTGGDSGVVRDSGAVEDDTGVRVDGGGGEIDSGAPGADSGASDVDSGSSDVDSGASGTDAGRDCTPQDAMGEGFCDAFFGYAWTGVGCGGVSGCSCVGADCDALYASVDECNAAHEGCFDPTGTFACGAALRCETGVEFCQTVVGGAAGSHPSYSCNPLPATCADPPTCASCFPVSGASSCSEAGAGEITNTLFAP
jgi:hypothetical protein